MLLATHSAHNRGAIPQACVSGMEGKGMERNHSKTKCLPHCRRLSSQRFGFGR